MADQELATPDQRAAVPCVGAIIRDADARLLLVLRGHQPAAGRWSIPGGRVDAGESDREAVIREVAEETGLVVVAGALVGTVVRGPYLINDYSCTVVGGTLMAGDDAAAVRWVPPGELDGYQLTEGLIETLTSWGQL